MTSKIVQRARLAAPICTLAVSLALSLGASVGTAQAGTFGVKVIDDEGQAVAGASVCIGLPGNFSQFGAIFTDGQGIASADVPNVPLVVTVSKTRFAAIRISEPARRFNLVKEVVLATGAQPGPRCRADSTLAGAGIRLSIDDVDIIVSGDRTFLSTMVSGAPTHFRMAANDEFDDSDWQSFDSYMTVPSALTKGAEVFVQLRRFDGGKNGWVEARSEVSIIPLRGDSML